MSAFSLDIDAKLLTKQRVHLLAAASRAWDGNTDLLPRSSMLEGILGLMDEISDQLEELGELDLGDKRRWWNEASIAVGFPPLDDEGDPLEPLQAIAKGLEK